MRRAKVIRLNKSLKSQRDSDQSLIPPSLKRKQMDKLIKLYRADHPDFVKTYESARIIVDLPTRARKAEAKSENKNME